MFRGVRCCSLFNWTPDSSSPGTADWSEHTSHNITSPHHHTQCALKRLSKYYLCTITSQKRITSIITSSHPTDSNRDPDTQLSLQAEKLRSKPRLQCRGFEQASCERYFESSKSEVGHSSLAVDFMSFWRPPRRPSPIAVRPATARARRGLPPLPPPAVARARRGAPRPHGRLQVGRSWRSLSDLELSKERSQIA